MTKQNPGKMGCFTKILLGLIGLILISSLFPATKKKSQEEQNMRLAKERAKVEAKYAKETLDTYVAAINIVQQNLGIKLIDNVSVFGKTAILTMTNLWHIRHYQIRLQDAQVLWEIWARICSPDDPDQARIELKDLMDNNVGGSSWVAGSVIKVNK